MSRLSPDSFGADHTGRTWTLEIELVQFPTFSFFKNSCGARFGSTYAKVGAIQGRLAWPLRKDDTLVREAFHIKTNKQKKTAVEPQGE